SPRTPRSKWSRSPSNQARWAPDRSVRIGSLYLCQDARTPRPAPSGIRKYSHVGQCLRPCRAPVLLQPAAESASVLADGGPASAEAYSSAGARQGRRHCPTLSSVLSPLGAGLGVLGVLALRKPTERHPAR